MAGVTTSLILGGVLGAAASTGGFGLMGGQKKAVQPEMPKPPKPEDAAEKARKIADYRRSSATQTIYSSPLGISGTANVARKVLGAG